MNTILIIREVEYAVAILDELYRESPLSASELAKRKNIPSPFIYRVLKKLEAKDILKIRRGPKGGYYLKGDCGKLTLYDVLSAFENTFFVTECIKPDYECVRNNDINCKMHRYFAHIQGVLRKEFQRNNLESLFGDK